MSIDKIQYDHLISIERIREALQDLQEQAELEYARAQPKGGATDHHIGLHYGKALGIAIAIDRIRQAIEE